MFQALGRWLIFRVVGLYLLRRLGEASTWKALLRILTGVGVAIDPERWATITAVGLALAEIFGVLAPDRFGRGMRGSGSRSPDLGGWSPGGDALSPDRRTVPGFEDLERFGGPGY